MRYFTSNFGTCTVWWQINVAIATNELRAWRAFGG